MIHFVRNRDDLLIEMSLFHKQRTREHNQVRHRYADEIVVFFMCMIKKRCSRTPALVKNNTMKTLALFEYNYVIV